MKRMIVGVAVIVVIVVLFVASCTAGPYATTDCLKSHIVFVNSGYTTCEETKYSDVCEYHPTITSTVVCDVESSPTVHPGWLWKR